jgi:hypothetical protein
MRYVRRTQMSYFLAGLAFVTTSLAQTTPPPTTTPSPSAASPTGASPGGAGTYSIEAEIFAYRSLQTNSVAIATDITPQLGRSGVVMVPSVSAILPAFQLWRSNMVITQNFVDRYNSGQFTSGCPAQAVAGPPSFGSYATAVTQGVGVIQSILALFSTSQTVTEFTGTIQDQALMTALSRRLRKSGVLVLTPDIFAPWIIANIDGTQFPFVGRLTKLVQIHGYLQDYYQCNTLAVNAGAQLQQAETTREADYAKLTDPAVTDTTRQAALAEIVKMKAQIDFLRPKIGVAGDDATSIQQGEMTIARSDAILTNSGSSAPAKATALADIRASDAANSAVESRLIISETLKAAKAQSLVSGIEAYLAGLTGGAVNFTPPAQSSTPTLVPATPGTGGTTPPAAAGASPTTPTPGASGPTPNASAASSAPPPIVTILQADGLARKMGFVVNDQGLNFNDDAWRVLWVKAMESGGATITETSVFGSHPHFGGGAVSGYALFSLDGSLICSGNAAAYGGFVKAQDFPKKEPSAPLIMLPLTGGCSADQP